MKYHISFVKIIYCTSTVESSTRPSIQAALTASTNQVLQHVMEELSLMLPPLLCNPFHHLTPRQPRIIFSLQRPLIHITLIILNPVIKNLLSIIVPPKILRQVLIVYPKINCHGCIRWTPQTQFFTDRFSHGTFGSCQ